MQYCAEKLDGSVCKLLVFAVVYNAKCQSQSATCVDQGSPRDRSSTKHETAHTDMTDDLQCGRFGMVV